MIFCKELNKEFSDKLEMFRELKANKKTIIASRKAKVKTKKNTGVLGFFDDKTKSVKAIPDMDNEYIYPIISTSLYLDSHTDVHMLGSMSKTAKEQNGKVYYVADHKLEVDSIIATPKNVEVMLMRLSWKDLGKNYEGETEALVFKIKKSEILHDKFLKLVERKDELQNSIRMMYLSMDFAFNTNEEGFEDEYKTWNEVYPQLANKEFADEVGYLFAVRELKIVMEGSAVLFGSNDSTPIKQPEAVSDTSKQEPSKDTRILDQLEKLVEQSKN